MDTFFFLSTNKLVSNTSTIVALFTSCDTVHIFFPLFGSRKMPSGNWLASSLLFFHCIRLRKVSVFCKRYTYFFLDIFLYHCAHFFAALLLFPDRLPANSRPSITFIFASSISAPLLAACIR